MNAQTAPTRDPVQEAADDVVHLYCECDENLAWCGENVTDLEYDTESERVCPLCALVDQQGGPTWCRKRR